MDVWIFGSGQPYGKYGSQNIPGAIFPRSALGATKINNTVCAGARREMAGESDIPAVSRDKAGGHLPLSVTSSISLHPKSPFPSFSTPAVVTQIYNSGRFLLLTYRTLAVLWRSSPS
jgi:hypothetical protein